MLKVCIHLVDLISAKTSSTSRTNLLAEITSGSIYLYALAAI